MKLCGPTPRRVIDEYTVKCLIGGLAVALPLIELYLTQGSIPSLSASYWDEHGPWPRTFFVGFLFAIAALMLAYNGKIWVEMGLARLGAAAALVLALFPCECRDRDHEILPHLHLVATAVLFAVLTGFCWIFRRRALDKLKLPQGRSGANARAYIYVGAGLGMVVSMVLFAGFIFFWREEKLVLAGEIVGLVSFGVAWLTASHVVEKGQDMFLKWRRSRSARRVPT